ncbi:adenylosuccinate lyase [Candidatus Gottesmanbacteria bacterium RIFCSPHIGHO2_01_FULL_39_10]|uniref:Adenylosuccinate lyase n=1 Tax=Candidatus Gottesmanbacteria bacterium RIFCSPHIGHO2_01_FULL_39_10 TaxID=1798375 RepID=A0A1F5ZLR7_9BACT|nr:MAG: adenylosuccinate lyase [Candidatus Gottesmanbacteria bacterium RIFCSPHIGHO2_01_FULL_39_10]
MDEQRLKAISLLDGRNWDKVKVISDYFSEYALIKYRIRVEVSYLIFLSQKTKLLRKLTPKEISLLNSIWQEFTIENGTRVKEIEKKINHDVKAVEYLLREKLEKTSMKDILEFIHFGLTSYDVNIPAYALMLKEYRQDVTLPTLNNLTRSLKLIINETKSMHMLARTHGQPALPTTMGKEIAVFYHRLEKEIYILKKIKIEGKLTGAVGNFNSFYFIDPGFNWLQFSKSFILSLDLSPNLITTQILPYDSWIQLFDSIKRINNILLGLATDIWWYISFEYFIQKKKENEVGSSTMSHKINPITFENAEGNLGLANSMFEFFCRKLSYSRLQRDLSDSTVKRDFGLAFGFSLLAWDSLLSGLERIRPNPHKMKEDLDKHWEIFSEGIQTYLRFKGYNNAYEILKEKTRGKVLNKVEIHKLVDNLPIKDEDKKKLKIQDLSEYSGLAEKLTDLTLNVLH